MTIERKDPGPFNPSWDLYRGDTGYVLTIPWGDQELVISL